MKIRKMDPEDFDNVKNVIQNTLFDIYGSDKIKWEDFSKYDIVFVAEEENMIVGCVAIKNVDDDWAKLKRMYILPDFQKRGIGNELLDKCIEYCRNSNFSRIILTTYLEMEGAVKFYKGKGFEIVDNPTDKYFTNSKLKEYNAKQIVMRREL